MTPAAAEAIRNSKPGDVLVLENTRRYAIERVLWDATPDDLPALAPKLAKLANEFAEKVATVYVNEALSAGSLDASSTDGAGGDGACGAGQLRGRRIRRPDAALPPGATGRVQRSEDRQARRPAGHDRSRHHSLGVHRRLAGDGVEKGRRRTGWQAILARRGGRSEELRQAVFHPARAHRASQAHDQRRPLQGHSIRAACRFHSARWPCVRDDRPHGSAVRRRAQNQRVLRPKSGRVHRRREKIWRQCRRLPQRRVRHVRRSALRNRHQKLHRPTQADERRRRGGVRRRRRRGRGAWKNTASPIGSRTASPPAAPCSTRWAAIRFRICLPCRWPTLLLLVQRLLVGKAENHCPVIALRDQNVAVFFRVNIRRKRTLGRN